MEIALERKKPISILWWVALVALATILLSEIFFSRNLSITVEESTGQEALCSGPAIIFCDNFENSAPVEESSGGPYLEHESAGGAFVRTAGVGLFGTQGMQRTYGTNDTTGSWIILRFGRMPGSTSPHRNTEDFRDVYWRNYVKTGPGWSGNPTSNLKESRVWVLASGANAFGPQAMIGHLWSNSDNDGTLMVDPASGTNSSGVVVTTGHNDFANLNFLGVGKGSTAVLSAGNADTWFCVESHVRLNDSQASQNGVQEFWIDGVLQASQTGLNFVSTYNAFAINVLQFGEGTWNSPGSPSANTRVWDNLVVSTERIGCIGGGSETTEAKWDADTTNINVPSGPCDGGLVNAVLDTGDKTEGTASMKLTYPGGQGDKGCKTLNITGLNIQHNSGDWLCQSWDMKFDPAFNWVGGQNKTKAHRVTAGIWTLYLKQSSITVSECPECDNCPSGDNCTVLSYDFDPATNNAVESWHSYTMGIKLQTGGGNDDGEMKLWIDGSLIDSEANQTYCTSCSGALQDAWGTFMMRSHPQEPTGTIWLDDFLTTSSSSECIARN